MIYSSGHFVNGSFLQVHRTSHNRHSTFDSFGCRQFFHSSIDRPYETVASTRVQVLPRLIFSIALIFTSYVKLRVESTSRDQTPEGWAHFFLTDPLILYSRSAHLIGEGPSQDLRTGQSLLEGMLKTNAASAERWFHLGGVLLESGQLEKGEYCFTRAAELAPNTADTWLNLANFYIGQNQP